ncbi:BamA/TamA family outer membrane protein [Dyadobacter sandarakinus]|uniref:BamA/TamA family outer membrane protein n=1 Tax=Dyadobacter sandarakinus TaxID=2747268 RepID=A0ABX7I7L9_9BACT|nr:BamA/TamA family outer membrane protein [Dyadobacter sandarakinus]QRR01173.1 BamA/TamA family outer membrane protein [Dyadobacter sandarakinus]
MLVVLIAGLATTGAHAQDGWVRRFIQKTISDTTEPGKPSFRIYPTLGYAPETSVEVGLSSLFLFQAKGDTVNRLSEIQAFTFFTFQSQYGIWLDNAIYGDQDKWFFLGRVRFQRFPLMYYGIGPDVPDKEPALVDANYILVRQRILRRIRKNLFFGPEVDYQQLYNTQFNQPEDYVHDEPLGSNGTRNLGLGAALVYDNRHNVLNVRKGFFGELSFLRYDKDFGSHHSFQGVNLDVRSFHPLKTRNVLAWQVYGFFFTGNVPFNQLALMGGEMIMRGYYTGRYRDKNMIAAQVEHRWLPFSFSQRLGGAVFAGGAVVAPTITGFNAKHIRPSGGVGLRYLLFRKKDIYLRLDVGFTEDGPGFYLFTGEAF